MLIGTAGKTKSRELRLGERVYGYTAYTFSNEYISVFILDITEKVRLESIAEAVDTMIGAIASGGFGASESMGWEIDRGGIEMVMIEYENGPVIFSPIGDDAFIVVVAERGSNLGLIRVKIKKHSKELMIAGVF